MLHYDVSYIVHTIAATYANKCIIENGVCRVGDAIQCKRVATRYCVAFIFRRYVLHIDIGNVVQAIATGYALCGITNNC